MNTPTPETDAKQKLKDMIGDEYVSTDFARKLERERDDAIQARKQSAAEWLEITRLADIRTTRAKRERDEAQETVESLTTTALDLLASLERARDERDEAREQLDAERALAGRLAEVIQCVMIEERDLPVTSCRGFIDFDQAILALTAWKEARSE